MTLSLSVISSFVIILGPTATVYLHLLISSNFGHWGATCSQLRLALYHPDPLVRSNFNYKALYKYEWKGNMYSSICSSIDALVEQLSGARPLMPHKLEELYA